MSYKLLLASFKHIYILMQLWLIYLYKQLRVLRPQYSYTCIYVYVCMCGSFEPRFVSCSLWHVINLIFWLCYAIAAFIRKIITLNLLVKRLCSYICCRRWDWQRKIEGSVYSDGLVWFVGFCGISTFVGYLTPNPFLCK